MPSVERDDLSAGTPRQQLTWRLLILAGIIGLLLLIAVSASAITLRTDQGAAGKPVPHQSMCAATQAGAASCLFATLTYIPNTIRSAPPPRLGSCTSQSANDHSCDELLTDVQQWTRWVAWVIGGLGALWVMLAYFQSANALKGYNMEDPWRRIVTRALEAVFVFFIAWRIGDIAQTVEAILDQHKTDSTSISSPPYLAISQFWGLVIAVMIQCFLFYLLPRIVFQVAAGFFALATQRWGPSLYQLPEASLRMMALTSVAELIALGVGIVYTPSLLTWLITTLAH